MAKNSIRRQSGRPLIQRILAPLGEISVLRDSWPSGWGFNFLPQYTLDSSRVNYELARELYRNTNDKYKLGAAFARPVVNTTAGFMGAPHFTHVDPEADQALEQFMSRWVGKLLRINRNALRDGDVFARINHQEDRFNPKETRFVPQIVPPEYVTPIPDPLTGTWREIVIRWPVTAYDEQGRKDKEYTVTERITPKMITIEAGAGAPQSVRDLNRDETNPWGFIPVVHFANESEETQLFGCSDLEPIEPFMRAYHDTLFFAVEGSKLFNRPKVRFSLKDVKSFIKDNFSEEEVRDKKLNFRGKELFFMQEGDSAEFISADSGTTGITALLELIYYCIVDVSETPEFAFGTAVASSKASVSEQMVPLARKIRRKRGMFEEPYGELASMSLAMWAKINNR
ncbi:MAG: phage portal protein, partial [bacterium]|nr:phage portal protein [bacterium]